jgi:hypothetical protein
VPIVSEWVTSADVFHFVSNHGESSNHSSGLSPKCRPTAGEQRDRSKALATRRQKNDYSLKRLSPSDDRDSHVSPASLRHGEVGSVTLEHAIFTSADTSQAQGYQLVAQSPGIGDATARELTIWCPSHDALVEGSTRELSINFHPLESGDFCVSRTAADGEEYSGRLGPRLTTQCLVVSSEMLSRNANSPFELMQAVVAGGRLPSADPMPRQLESIQMPARCSVMNIALVEKLTEQFGADRVANLVELALTSKSLAFVAPTAQQTGSPTIDRVMAGLFNCLPVMCRTAYSFTTGLRHSARRPFRWQVVEADASVQRQMVRQHAMTIVNLDDLAALDELLSQTARRHGWSAFVGECLRRGDIDALKQQLRPEQTNLNLSSLSQLGDELLREMNRRSPGNTPLPVPAPTMTVRHAHASHRSSNADQLADADVTAETIQKPQGPSHTLCPDSTVVIEKLEALDDAVYESIAGDTLSFERLRRLWPEVLSEFGSDLVEESREHYLRYALTVWNDFINMDAGGPERATAALDVVCLLSDG